MLSKVGYAETVARHRQKGILQSEGVLNELERLGFSENRAKEVVGEILNSEENEPKDRLKAAEMVFKVSGSYAAEKHLNVTVQITKEERDKILGISSKVREEMTQNEING